MIYNLGLHHLFLVLGFIFTAETFAWANGPERPRARVRRGVMMDMPAVDSKFCTRVISSSLDPAVLADPSRVFSWRDLEPGTVVQIGEERPVVFEGIAPRGLLDGPEGQRVVKILFSTVRPASEGRRVRSDFRILEVGELSLETVRRINREDLAAFAPSPQRLREEIGRAATIRVEGLISRIDGRLSLSSQAIHTQAEMNSAVKLNFTGARAYTPVENLDPHLVSFPRELALGGVEGIVESSLDYHYGVSNGLIHEGILPRDLPVDAGYNFVLLESGAWVFGRVTDSWRFGVSSVALAGGRPVLAAGEIFIAQDGTYLWNLDSILSKYLRNEGTGGPRAEQLMPQRVQNLLERQFANTPRPRRQGTLVVGRPVLVDVDMTEAPSLKKIRNLCRSDAFRAHNGALCEANGWGEALQSPD